MAPSRVTTSPRPTRRRSVRFCFALPRCAIGALSLPVSMKVAKLVMSRATELVSRPKRAHAVNASFSSICARDCRGSACIASQSRRWSRAEAGILVNRSAAVVRHQSAYPRLEQGSVTRCNTVSAR